MHVFDDFREAYSWLRHNTPEDAKVKRLHISNCQAFSERAGQTGWTDGQAPVEHWPASAARW